MTDYCGNVIYENGVLKMILTAEGYITLNGTTPTYHYYLRDHLGNNRVVVNQSGTVAQVNHYYPFGGVFGEGIASSDQPYKYNDKELDRTNGLDLYDYSARFMDAALGQFTTVDPMAEKYYSISPYAYVGNNPVKRIDPDGTDIWEMDHNGRITWKEESHRHYLYALDADGNRTENSIRIKDRTILDGLKGTDDIKSVTVDKGSKNDLFKVFKFAADNTQNEWVIYKYNHDNSTKYTLGTKSQKENAGNPGTYGIRTIPDAKVHSHPYIATDRTSELSSMGVDSRTGNPVSTGGDWTNVRSDVKRNNGTQRTLSYVYFQNTTNLYHINYNGPAFIRKINNNHNRFFFWNFLIKYNMSKVICISLIITVCIRCNYRGNTDKNEISQEGKLYVEQNELFFLHSALNDSLLYYMKTIGEIANPLQADKITNIIFLPGYFPGEENDTLVTFLTLLTPYEIDELQTELTLKGGGKINGEHIAVYYDYFKGLDHIVNECLLDLDYIESISTTIPIDTISRTWYYDTCEWIYKLKGDSLKIYRKIDLTSQGLNYIITDF